MDTTAAPPLQWYASYEQVPRVGEPGKESYPTDCSGWLWVTSPGTARALAEAAQQVIVTIIVIIIIIIIIIIMALTGANRKV